LLDVAKDFVSPEAIQWQLSGMNAPSRELGRPTSIELAAVR